MKRGWCRKFLALLLVCCVLTNYTVTVLADIGGDVDNALKGSDAYTAIKYVLTQMGAIFAGSLDDVIKNNQALLDYADNGLPVTKDDKGNINIKNEVVNNIYNAVKSNITALNGYYLVEPEQSLTDYFFGMKDIPISQMTSCISSFRDFTVEGFGISCESVNTVLLPSTKIWGCYISGNSVFGYSTAGSVAFGNYSYGPHVTGNRYGWKPSGYNFTPVSVTIDYFKNNLICDAPVKLFYTQQDLLYYVNFGGKVYTTNKFNHYAPADITYNSSVINNTNWNEINNTIYNNILNNYGSTPESDIQDMIDGKFDEVISQLGDIGGSVDDVNTTMNSWLSRIYKLLGVVSNNLITSVTALSDVLGQSKLIVENIQKIPISIKGYFDNLGKSLDAHFKDLIDAVEGIESGGSGSTIWDLLIGLLGGAIGGLLTGVIQQFIDGILSLDELTESINGILKNLDFKFKPLVTASKTKFPFSLPWDFIAVILLLKSEPQTPRFELPLDIKSFGIRETVVLDMSEFAALSKASRTFLSITFIMILILITNKFFGGDK